MAVGGLIQQHELLDAHEQRITEVVQRFKQQLDQDE